MAGAVKSPLLPRRAEIEQDDAVQRIIADSFREHPELLQFAETLTNTISIIRTIMLASTAVAKRVSHDWVFVETVLLLVEASLNMTLALSDMGNPWKTTSNDMFTFARIDNLRFIPV